MAVLNNSALVGAAGKGGGAAALPQRSLRFNSADSSFLSRTPGSAGNRKTYTFSCWVKRSKLGTLQYVIQAYGGGSYRASLFFDTDDTLYFALGNTSPAIRTIAVFRDVSAWYHIVLAIDTTQSTQSAGMKLYVNGTQQTVTNSGTYTQNDDGWINSTSAHQISGTSGYYLDGYLANIHFIDGQALTPSAFAYTDPVTGRWEPKAYAGSYSGNSFYLDFSDNSAATAAALGADRSGLGNNWVPNNFTATSSNKYSQTTTGTAPTLYGANSAYIKAFDGDINTSFAWTAGTWAMSWTSLPAPVVVTSTLKIHCYPRLGTLTVNINGNNVASITGNTVDWRTIGFTGTINTISFTGTDTYSMVEAIEVDGQILVDGNDSGIDSLRDHPVSAGVDTGLGGQVSGNYATLNPLNISNGANTSPLGLTNGNLDFNAPGNLYRAYTSSTQTIGSKAYWELLVNTNNKTYTQVGISPADEYKAANDNINLGNHGANSVGWSMTDGAVRKNGSVVYTTTAPSLGSVVGMAFDPSSGEVFCWVNGVAQNSGNAVTTVSTTKSYYVTVLEVYASSVNSINFGARPFAFAAPAGFKCLCDQNLPTPPIIKPADYFDVLLWSGTGGNRSFSSLNMSPDFVWIKQRNAAFSTGHQLYDIVRGAGSDKELDSAGTAAEGAGNIDQYGWLSSFDSNGFSVTAGPIGADYVNASGFTYVAWAWDAGATTVVDNTGSIQSTRRTNAASGCSIITYTGTGSAATVGHGLGAAPSLLIVKQRNAVRGWSVYHKDIGANHYLELQTANAKGGPYSGLWNNTEPTSTVFSILNDGGSNASGGTYIAYAFAPVANFSAFGSYTGNGSSDGPFVFTGHRSRWLMVKRTDVSDSWYIYDTARNTYNVSNFALYAQSSLGEQTETANIFDVLSNGFKVRGAGGGSNVNGGTYIWASFAENPFQYARAR